MNKTKIFVGFSPITHSIEFSKKAVIEGTQMALSHVEEVCEDGQTITGQVWPSMKQSATTKPYNLKLEVFVLPLLFVHLNTEVFYSR